MSLLPKLSTDDLAELQYITSLLQTSDRSSGLRDDLQKLHRKCKGKGGRRGEDEEGHCNDVNSDMSDFSIRDVNISLFLRSRYHIVVDPAEVRSAILPGLASPSPSRGDGASDADADAGGVVDLAEIVAMLLMPVLSNLRGAAMNETANLNHRSKLCRETAMIRQLRVRRRNSNDHGAGETQLNDRADDAFVVSTALDIALAAVINDISGLLPTINQLEYPRLTPELVRAILENYGLADFFPANEVPAIIDEIIVAAGGDMQGSGSDRRLDPHSFAKLLTHDTALLEPSGARDETIEALDDSKGGLDSEDQKDEDEANSLRGDSNDGTSNEDKQQDRYELFGFSTASIDFVAGLYNFRIITVLLWIFVNLFVLSQILQDYTGRSFFAIAHNFGTKKSNLVPNRGVCSSSFECVSNCCVWNPLWGKRCLTESWFSECYEEYKEYDFVESGTPDHQDAAVELFVGGNEVGVSTLRILSYNLYLILLASDGVSDLDNRAAQITDFFANAGHTHDIVALQETWVSYARIRDGMIAAGYCHHVYDDRGSFGSGLAIYSKHPIVNHEFRGWRDACDGADCVADKGVIHARIDMNGQKVNIFNTHTIYAAKNHEVRRRQYKVIREFVDEKGNQSEPAFIVGDFNEDKVQTGELYKTLLNDLNAGDFMLDNTSSVYSYNPQNNTLIDPNVPGASSIQRALDFVLYDKSSGSLSPQTNRSTCRYMQPKNVQGGDLSDHFPMSCNVKIDWSKVLSQSPSEIMLVDSARDRQKSEIDGPSNTPMSEEAQIISTYLSRWSYRTLILILFGMLSMWGGSLGHHASSRRKSCSSDESRTITSIIILSSVGLLPALAYYWDEVSYNSVFWFAQLGAAISATAAVLVYVYFAAHHCFMSPFHGRDEATHNEATAHAANAKLLNMVENAVQIRNITTSNQQKDVDAMLNFYIATAGASNSSDTPDSFLDNKLLRVGWCWKQLLSGRLSGEDGINISTKFLALNVLLFIIPICFVLGGVNLSSLLKQHNEVDMLNHGMKLFLQLADFDSERLQSHLENICPTVASDLGHSDVSPQSCLQLLQITLSEYLRHALRIAQFGQYVIQAPIAVGTTVATLHGFYSAILFTPSVIHSTFKLRLGRIPFWDDPRQFTLLLSRIDYTRELIGKIFWLGLLGPFMLGAVIALFLFLLLWHITRSYVLRLVAIMIGVGVTLAIKYIIGAGLVDSAYRGFYRERINRSNVAGLVVESITIGLGLASAAVRMALAQTILFLYIGRADKPIFDEGVCVGLDNSMLCTRDYLPRSFLQEILIGEAHHHPYIETLGHIWLTKLRHGDKFATRAGYIMRLVFAMVLMPWLRVYRIAARQGLESERQLHKSITATRFSASEMFMSKSLRDFHSKRLHSLENSKSLGNFSSSRRLLSSETTTPLDWQSDLE